MKRKHTIELQCMRLKGEHNNFPHTLISMLQFLPELHAYMLIDQEKSWLLLLPLHQLNCLTSIKNQRRKKAIQLFKSITPIVSVDRGAECLPALNVGAVVWFTTGDVACDMLTFDLGNVNA